MFGKTPWMGASPLRIRPSKCLLHLQGAKKGAQELKKSYNGWEYEIYKCIYIYTWWWVTYQESDQILSTNRFRHHDYDSHWNCQWLKDKFIFLPTSHHTPKAKTNHVHGFSVFKFFKNTLRFRKPDLLQFRSHTPAFTFTFGGSFWWSPGANRPSHPNGKFATQIKGWQENMLIQEQWSLLFCWSPASLFCRVHALKYLMPCTMTMHQILCKSSQYLQTNSIKIKS